MMAGPTDQRRDLRIEMRARRSALSEDDQAAASMALMARLARVPVLRDAALVAGYRAVRGEPDIDAALLLLMERGTTVTLPRVVGERLEFVVWNPDEESCAGPFGIPEPTGDTRFPLAAHDVVVAPLVAFDATGNRLGQGGGYYDRALATREGRRPLVIGVAHGFQEVDAIETEPWDIALDAVVTEEGIRDFAPGALDGPL